MSPALIKDMDPFKLLQNILTSYIEKSPKTYLYVKGIVIPFRGNWSTHLIIHWSRLLILE